MKQLFLFLIIGTCIFCSCKKQSAIVIDKKEEKQAGVVDSLLPSDCIPANFTTPMGTKVVYTKVDHAVKLSWGNDTYIRSHDSLFTCELDEYGNRWDWIPKYVAETKNYLIFENVLSTSSGGNPSPIEFTAIILPKKATDLIYEKDLYIDKHEDYIIYLPGATADSLAIMNLETKKTQICRLLPAPVPFAKSPTFIITKTGISKQNLNVEYESLDKNDSVVIQKNKFKLKV